ncbi:ATP-dependent zinc protease [Alkalimarinus sediminis]|uniref:RimK/LysX family protein n=1 Tax=Alkalimarinus sediminis TaxID=1632866 RepID=A0A9E8HFW5_9ALTE|nr:RimK/LysX family protein [Alkalimarinus sediminis]UZW73689.1 RimK/LysX family protein [Alkalimarinus sediminis]
MPTNESDQIILGWREWVEFPELEIDNLIAKVDSGAKTSALHAYHVEPFNKGDTPWVRFKLHPIQDNNEVSITLEAKLSDRRHVSDSGGHKELRYVIEAVMNIGGHERRGEITLTDRDSMKYRMLIGRNILKQGFLVNAKQSFACGKPET